MKCCLLIIAALIIWFLLIGKTANPQNQALTKKWVSYVFKEIGYGANWVSERIK